MRSLGSVAKHYRLAPVQRSLRMSSKCGGRLHIYYVVAPDVRDLGVSFFAALHQSYMFHVFHFINLSCPHLCATGRTNCNKLQRSSFLASGKQKPESLLIDSCLYKCFALIVIMT